MRRLLAALLLLVGMSFGQAILLPISGSTSGPANQVATPAYDHDTGAYTLPVSVTITDATGGAAITYCTNTGSDCNPVGGTSYTVPVVISVTATHLCSYATHAGMTDSATKCATYTASSATRQIYFGSYTGNGTDNHAITGVGFQPMIVFVKAATGSHPGLFKTSAHSGTVSSSTTNAADDASTGIKSLDSGGFTLGTAVEGNASGVVYQYVALRDTDTTKFEVGTYSGDGNDNRNIVLSGAFAPNLVLVKRSTGANYAYWRTTAFTGDSSVSMDNAGTGTNRIQAFNSNGFQVGTNAAINASGVLYYYWATAYGTDVFETGSYTGDASNPKTITFGTGTFTPGFANAKSNSSSAAFWATSNMTGGTSFGWAGDADATSSGVATLASGGFTVGGYLNAAATVYYYWAFKGP